MRLAATRIWTTAVLDLDSGLGWEAPLPSTGFPALDAQNAASDPQTTPELPTAKRHRLAPFELGWVEQRAGAGFMHMGMGSSEEGWSEGSHQIPRNDLAMQALARTQTKWGWQNPLRV
mmetsp:Transcript_7790/g.11772  ORF Transcript_7790/g.11772 Transcript_7790/m.11772 type:complete len:118 (+) Transcript_7790:909-1262(+)